MPLRIRLLGAPLAAELHGLRWELLRHPETGESLVTYRAGTSVDPRVIRYR